MLYDEEKDYIMRMIREVSRVLFSIIFGKRYAQVELEIRNKYETTGTPQNALKDLVDRGQIDKAENSAVELALVDIELVEYYFIMRNISHQTYAVAVENFAARCLRINVIAGGTGGKRLVFAAVNQLPVRQSRRKSGKHRQRHDNADGVKSVLRLSAQAVTSCQRIIR